MAKCDRVHPKPELMVVEPAKKRQKIEGSKVLLSLFCEDSAATKGHDFMTRCAKMGLQ